MPKDILLYGSINEFSARQFITEVDEHEEEELTVRVNTKGGSPEFAFGMIAKFAEFAGTKNVKVDGAAMSMGAYYLAYADNVTALDVSEIAIHRAAYPIWFEGSDEFFTDALKGNLERVNKNLRKALEAKIDVKKFEEMKGVKMNDIFSMDSRIDVFMSAAEAKKIGLVDKINKITPTKKAEIDASMVEMSAKFGNPVETKIENKPAEEPAAEHKSNNQKNKKMTIEEFKAKHPELFNKVHNTAFEAGVEAEKDRTGAWLVYADADMKTVLAGVKDGKAMSQTDVATLGRAAAGLTAVANIEDDSAGEIKTEKPLTAEAKKDKETADFLAEVTNTEKS